ncbi:MAG: hypothetical protein WD558_01170 [Pseudomonadales bacterium]
MDETPIQAGKSSEHGGSMPISGYLFKEFEKGKIALSDLLNLSEFADA